MAGLPNFAFHGARSLSVTPRARDYFGKRRPTDRDDRFGQNAPDVCQWSGYRTLVPRISVKIERLPWRWLEVL
jgi:hypothetical protein